jgi:hypothetical protein
MTRSIRRHLYVLHAYVALSLLVFAVLALSAFRQPPAAQKFTELTAERINIVDADGTLRLVISNKDRMHPGVIGGKVIQRSRPVAGLLFFNDKGDEAGGVTVTGRDVNGRRTASAGIMFDQLDQDQTIGFDYSENNGRRTAGFKVWDRPDSPLSELVDQLNAANAIKDSAEREAAVAKVRAAAPKAAQRVFVGKTGERVASVMLADAEGRNRLALKVDAEGTASIEFLDEQGKVMQRITPPRPDR